MKTLLSEADIRDGVERMAREIAQRFQGQHLVVMGVMTGSVVLLADLIRLLDIPLRVGVVWASSYRGTATDRNELRMDVAMMPNITGHNVLLVDDIFDTGHTLQGLIAEVKKCNPTSVHSAVLLWKEGRQEVTIEPDIVGFKIPNEFVVGYGLDYEDHYRHLPYLASLDDDDLASWRS